MLDDSKLDDLKERLDSPEGFRSFMIQFANRTVTLMAITQFLGETRAALGRVEDPDLVAEAYDRAKTNVETLMRPYRSVYGDDAWDYIWEGIEESIDELKVTSVSSPW